jgi:uncharacterized membrane protein YdbT with pleckstrin-like domain
MKKYFAGQHEDEEVLFTFRRHLIAMRKGFYMLLIPFLIACVPVLIWPDNLNNVVIAFGGLAIGLVLFFYHWMGWYFSIFIVTDQRLRQITQKGFFNRSIIDIGISKIQNVSYNVPGFTAAMFGFGNLVVQTYVGNLYLEKIEHPTKIFNDLLQVLKEHGNKAGTNYEEAFE